MKTAYLGALLLASALLLSTAFTAHASNVCKLVFDSNGKEAQLINWRKDISNTDNAKTLAGTNATREREIKDYVRQIENSVLNLSSTDLMGFWPEAGAKISTLVETGGYESGVITRYAVTGLGPKGILNATLGLPVSGHDGAANAKIWAKSDLYYVTHEASNRETYLVKDAKSLDLTTIQEVAIPMVKGQVVKILYWRKGSAGPMGFPEGRIIEFVWDGN